ncbi:hypothetical protein [Truepera radiovictrix]|nr:hypothetical protein [Truepera radiovictrix]WMT56687.1 hypothetical protein RCV51_11800 [Truepera radiovictrix]
MQIRPSQRQTPGPYPPRGGPLLHEQLAQRRRAGARLLRGGGLALATSLVAWALAAPLPYHLLALALAFALGYLWRPKRTDERAHAWALSWIDAQSGLAYRTALELPPQEDPYGLGAAVRRRAEASAKRLAPPPTQPWWLPLVVLATLFALLPALPVPNLGAPLRTPFGTPSTPHGGGDTPAPPPPEPSTAAEPSEEASAATPSGRAAGDPVAEETPSEARVGAGAGGSGEAGAPSGEVGEAAALERYLSSLAELEAAEGAPQTRPTSPFGSLGAPPDDLSPEMRFGDAETLDGRDLADAQRGTETAPPEEAASEPSAGDTGGDEAEGGGARDDAGQAGSAESAAGEAEDGSGSGEGSAPQDAPAAPPPGGAGAEGAPSPEAGEEAGLQGDEATGDEAVGEGAAGSPSAPEESGAEIGGGGSAETAGDAPSDAAQGAAQGGGGEDAAGEPQDRLGDPPQGPLQRLPGVRGEDGPSQRGEVLQPGTENFVLPSSREPAEYARAAEEAIREGRLPLEYQDIVREYFR